MVQLYVLQGISTSTDKLDVRDNDYVGISIIS